MVNHFVHSTLNAAAQMRPDLGSVSPFTNNGTILSYPYMNTANSLPLDCSLKKLCALLEGQSTGNSPVTAPPLLAALATTVSPFGWTAGGGVEFAISPNGSVKAEYLYVDFQNQTLGPGTFKPIENVVRGGVNYRF